MTYLLDTSVWINGVTMPDVFPSRIRKLLQTKDPKDLCSVSLLETAILFRLKRLDFQGTLQDLFTAGLAADVRVLELTPAITAATNDLPKDFPGDPFDRTIVATAAAHKATLITADAAIRDAEACLVEYYPFKSTRHPARR